MRWCCKLKRDDVFLRLKDRSNDFKFNTEVAEVFDDMLIRSVPFYLEQQKMIKQIAKTFYINGTIIYDLGCSTANTLVNLCSEFNQSVKLIGYDNSQPMIEQAKQKVKEYGYENQIEIRYGDLNKDVPELPLGNASVVIMCWTLQFIRPLQRDYLLKWINDGLVENGVLIVAEKVLTNNSDINRFFIEFYYDFKRKNGYSEVEILRKREALENVLIPYRINENVELFKRSGFHTVETFFQWYNFVGFLCVKSVN